jgi:hypothetical protein
MASIFLSLRFTCVRRFRKFLSSSSLRLRCVVAREIKSRDIRTCGTRTGHTRVHQIPRLHLAALPGLRRLSAQRPLHSHLGPVHRRLEGCYWSSPLRAVWGLEHNGGRAHTAHADDQEDPCRTRSRRQSHILRSISPCQCSRNGRPRTNVSRSDRHQHHQRNQRSRHRARGPRGAGKGSC